MQDEVDSLARLATLIGITDIRFNDREVCPTVEWFEVFSAAGRKVVEGDDALVTIQQCLDEMRTDKTSGARDQPGAHFLVVTDVTHA